MLLTIYLGNCNYTYGTIPWYNEPNEYLRLIPNSRTKTFLTIIAERPSTKNLMTLHKIKEWRSFFYHPVALVTKTSTAIKAQYYIHVTLSQVENSRLDMPFSFLCVQYSRCFSCSLPCEALLQKLLFQINFWRQSQEANLLVVLLAPRHEHKRHASFCCRTHENWRTAFGTSKLNVAFVNGVQQERII